MIRVLVLGLIAATSAAPTTPDSLGQAINNYVNSQIEAAIAGVKNDLNTSSHENTPTYNSAASNSSSDNLNQAINNFVNSQIEGVSRQLMEVVNKTYSDNQFKVNVNVSSYTPQEISVKTGKGFLQIQAKHKNNLGNMMFHKYGLPEDVNASLVTATLTADRILSVTVPLNGAHKVTNEDVVIVNSSFGTDPQTVTNVNVLTDVHDVPVKNLNGKQ